MSVGESKKLAELNNLIWSPQEDWNEQVAMIRTTLSDQIFV
jgi:hypothetical protein